MSLLTIPYDIFVPGNIGYAPEFNANWAAIKSWSASIDDTNLSPAGITLYSKGKPGTITSTLFGTSCVKQSAIDYTSAGVGVLAWQSGSVYRGNGGNRTIWIKKQETLLADLAEHTITVDWSATDSVDGAFTFPDATKVHVIPTFADNVGGTRISGTAAELSYMTVTAITTTGCTIKYRFRALPAPGNVNLIAIVSGGA